MKKALIIILFVTTMVTLQWRHSLNADEGVILSGAWNMYNGKIIYKDFFELIAPGSLYFAYATMLFFGPNYYAILFASMILQLISVYAVYAIFVRLTKKIGWAYFTAYAWLIVSSIAYPIINYNTYSTFLASFLLLLLLTYLERKKNYLMVFTGILTACVSFFLQTKGLAMFAATLLFLSFLVLKKIISIKPLALFITAYMSAIFIGLLFWGKYIITNLLILYAGYIKIATTPLSYQALIIFSTLCFLFLFIFILKNKVSHGILLCFFFQFGLMLSYMNNPDKYHVWLNAFPFIILVFIYISSFRFWEKYLVIKIYAISTIGIIMAIYLSITAVRSFYETAFIEKIFLTLKNIIGDENIFSYPFLPNMYFELQKPNPYFNDILIENQWPKEYFEKNLEILKIEKPKFIITDYSAVEKYKHSYQNPIDIYIREKYKKISSIGSIDIWEIL